MKVCIGGTFDPLHKGHKTLLRKACEIAGNQGKVFIGITEGELIKGKQLVCSFEKRKKKIQKFLSTIQGTCTIQVQPIYDIFGPTLEQDFDAIIISSESKKNAEIINKQRITRGKKSLQIIEIPLVLADDHLPIRSSRIKHHEIDTEGKILYHN